MIVLLVTAWLMVAAPAWAHGAASSPPSRAFVCGPAGAAAAAGAAFTFRYRVTIPHKGSFRLYVTRDGYRPTRALRWADLEAKPFLTVTDPAIRDGAYVLRGRLPAAKSGRHVIYTIWRTTSTPDTYYSCSDVVFRAPAGAAAPSVTRRGPSPNAMSASASGVAVVADPVRTTPVAATSRTGLTLPLLLAAGAGLLGGAAFLIIRYRRPVDRRIG